MRARGAVVVLAFLLAAAATGAVFMYTRNVRDDARAGEEMVRVIVAKDDIPAGLDLNDLISKGAFTSIEVPSSTVIQGAVVTLSELKDQETGAAILAGEQISGARLRGEEEVGGGVLGIPAGFQALTMQIETSRAVGEVLRRGDHVTIYATFENAGKFRASARQRTSQGGRQERVSGAVESVPGMTVTLVADVEVLKMTRPGTAQGVGSGGSDRDPKVLVTMALQPKDAQRVIFAKERGTLYLSLLPPGQEGSDEAPLTFLEVVK